MENENKRPCIYIEKIYSERERSRERERERECMCVKEIESSSGYSLKTPT